MSVFSDSVVRGCVMYGELLGHSYALKVDCEVIGQEFPVTIGLEEFAQVAELSSEAGVVSNIAGVGFTLCAHQRCVHSTFAVVDKHEIIDASVNGHDRRRTPDVHVDVVAESVSKWGLVQEGNWRVTCLGLKTRCALGLAEVSHDNAVKTVVLGHLLKILVVEVG